MEKIRVLCVAPYEGMRSLMTKIAESKYPEIHLDVVVGDLQKGVETAKNHFHADYDVIISRGGTAQLIREIVPLPVIDILISEYDILRTLHLAKSASTKRAIVGFPSITNSAGLLSELTGIPLRAFTIHREDEVYQVLNSVAAEGYDTIICDTVTSLNARSVGLNAILITSSQESISRAFDDAIVLCRNVKRLQIENHFFREIIGAQSNETVVFDQNADLYFSTLESDDKDEVIQMLLKEIPSCNAFESTRLVKSLNSSLYSIKAQRFSVDNKPYTTFYLNRSRNTIPSKRFGITYYSLSEAVQCLEDSLHFISGSIPNFESGLATTLQISHPVLILGEPGVEKDHIAIYLYSRSTYTNHPMISIDSALLNSKSWDFLLNSHNSPLVHSNNTVYISNIHTLSDEGTRLMFGAINSMDVCKRNRIIFSYSCDSGHPLSPIASDYINSFQYQKLTVPPLRTQSELIPAMISLYLNRLNITQSHEIIGMEPNASALMKSFSWPYNHAQLKRVLNELASASEDSIIQFECVRRILQLENVSPIVESVTGEMVANRFDISRTLEEMTADIVQRVLTECSGNQTNAAKRLGISRTTLWRIASKNSDAGK